MHRMQMNCVTAQNLSDIKAVVQKQTPDQRRGRGGGLPRVTVKASAGADASLNMCPV